MLELVEYILKMASICYILLVLLTWLGKGLLRVVDVLFRGNCQCYRLGGRLGVRLNSAYKVLQRRDLAHVAKSRKLQRW